jgi:hypothetical protein
MLPTTFLKVVGACLLVFGVYDTSVYRYAITHSKETFDFFGHRLSPNHPLVKVGFVLVLTFYYAVGMTMLVFG